MRDLFFSNHIPPLFSDPEKNIKHNFFAVLLTA